MSDYGLDEGAIEVRSPTGADFFSSPCVQTGSGANPASYPMDTGDPFPGGKARPGRDADHSPPSPWRVAGQLYFFFFTFTIYLCIENMVAKDHNK
jgi:hypothetical protein